MVTNQYPWDLLNNLGVRLVWPNAGESVEVEPFTFPPAFQERLTADGYEINRPIVVSRASLIDALLFEQA